jgi:hypothetical protein
MVRKRDKKGAFYYEPPYTPEEEADFYRRVGGSPVAFTRPSSTVAQPQKPKREAPRKA